MNTENPVMPQDEKVVVYETPDGEMRMEAFVCFRWGKVCGMSSKSPVRFVGRGLWNMAMFLRMRIRQDTISPYRQPGQDWCSMPGRQCL